MEVGFVLSERQSVRITTSDRYGYLTANSCEYITSRLLARNDGGMHLPTLFVLDNASCYLWGSLSIDRLDKEGDSKSYSLSVRLIPAGAM